MAYFLKYLKSIPANIISEFENTEIPAINYVITFFCIILLRHFAESFSQVGNYLNLPYQVFLVDIIHFALCYVTLAMLIIAMFHYAANTPVAMACRVVLPGFILLLLAPLLDLILTRGHGVNMMYFVPGLVPSLVSAYFTIGANYPGISSGMRIELIIAIVGFFAYFRVKNLNIFVSLLYAWMTYTLIFLVAASPYFLQWFIGLFGFNAALSSLLMVHFYMLVLVILGAFLFYEHDRNLFWSVFQEIKLHRLVHYELLILLGAAFGISGMPRDAIISAQYTQYVIISLILSMISILFLFLSFVPIRKIILIDQDKADYQEHRSTNYCMAGVFILLSGFYAFMVDTKVLFLIGLIASNCCLYFMLPLKFERLAIISKLLLALNAVALLLTGYLVITQRIIGFPGILYWIFFTGYFMAANVVDLDDTRAGIRRGALTNIAGERHARIIIGISSLALFMAFFYISKSVYFLLAAMIAGIIEILLLNMKRYREFAVFGFANFCCFLFVGYLLLTAGSFFTG